MKTSTGFTSVLSLLVILFLISCNSSGSKGASAKETSELTKVEVSVTGMTCTGCEQTIQKNVMKVEGIKSVKATFTDGKALVEYDASQADTSEIRAAITGAGYRVSAFSGLTTSETQK